MKKHLLSSAYQIIAIIGLGFIALAVGVALGACGSTPADPYVPTEITWVPQTTINGDPILDTLVWYSDDLEDPYESREGIQSSGGRRWIVVFRGSLVPKDSHLSQTRPEDMPINDTMRDTTCLAEQPFLLIDKDLQ